MFSKNFLQHTIKCLKSVFSGQARFLKVLDAATSCNSRCCSTMHRRSKGSSSFRDLDELFSNECAVKPEKSSSTRTKKKGIKNKVKIQTSDQNVRMSERKSLEIGLGGNGEGKDDAKGSVMVEKLQKMKMKMMDERSSEHLMDIEEIIYYYSLITCQTFQEIVDKFFRDLYIEFSILPGSDG